MTPTERTEIVNAARSYERIVAERRSYFLKITALAREKRQAEATEHKALFWECNGRMKRAECLLAERIYWQGEFIRVDGVMYAPHSCDSLTRIPLADIEDLALLVDSEDMPARIDMGTGKGVEE